MLPETTVATYGLPMWKSCHAYIALVVTVQSVSGCGVPAVAVAVNVAGVPTGTVKVVGLKVMVTPLTVPWA